MHEMSAGYEIWHTAPRWLCWPVKLDLPPSRRHWRLILELPGTGRGMTVWLWELIHRG